MSAANAAHAAPRGSRILRRGRAARRALGHDGVQPGSRRLDRHAGPLEEEADFEQRRAPPEDVELARRQWWRRMRLPAHMKVGLLSQRERH